MKMQTLEQAAQGNRPITALFYCAPGVGKSTLLSIIAEQSKGRTLVLDVDRTFVNAVSKLEVVHDLSKVDIVEIENRGREVNRDTKEVVIAGTFESWTDTLVEIGKMNLDEYDNICVDNISELERCILSDLGAQGKNKGVPAQPDYQYMQFKLVNSLRYMKSWGKNIFWTAWETTDQFQNPDGGWYSRQFPKVNGKIVDNICGLCDIVGKITVNKEGKRGLILEATQNTYAKNQIDCRKGCLVEDFLKFERS